MTRLPALDIPSTLSSSAARTASLKRETSEICRERAAADLLESAAMINANQRLRLETSAASWTVRADILERVENGFARKSAEAIASRQVIGDEPTSEPNRY